jgi:hypothetical protein
MYAPRLLLLGALGCVQPLPDYSLEPTVPAVEVEVYEVAEQPRKPLAEPDRWPRLCPAPGALGDHTRDGDRFDYDPLPTHIDRVWGAVDRATGDYDWHVAFSDDYLLREQVVVGRATVLEDGTLELVQEERTRWRDQHVETATVRAVWDGCSVDQTREDEDGREWLHIGRFDGDLYRFHEERETLRGYRAWFGGVVHADGTREEESRLRTNTWEYTEVRTDWSDGTTQASYMLQHGGNGVMYEMVRSRVGDRQVDVEAVGEPCVFEGSAGYVVDAYGHGAGWMTPCDGEGTELTCTMTITPAGCTAMCDQGIQYVCDWR